MTIFSECRVLFSSRVKISVSINVYSWLVVMHTYFYCHYNNYNTAISDLRNFRARSNLLPEAY